MLMRYKPLSKLRIVGVGLCLMAILLNSVTPAHSLTPWSQEMSIEKIYISVNLNNVSLEEAFSRIVAKTEINFQYDKRLVANKKIKKNFSNASLGELLRYISNETGLSFRRVNETIYVIDKPVRSVEEELSQASSMAPC